MAAYESATEKDQAEALVYTSVDDARSSLRCARKTGGTPRSVLTMARDLAASLEYKTKVQLFESELRRLA